MKVSTVNFLAALKSTAMSNKNYFSIKANFQIAQVVNCLYLKSYILSYNYCVRQNNIKIYFNNDLTLNFFSNLKIMSISSHVKYIKYLDICKIINQYKILIISTNKGLLTGEECKKYKIGGKLLFLS